MVIATGVSCYYPADYWATVVQQVKKILKPGGWLLLEHGYDQAFAVRQLLQENGFIDVQSRQDLAGIARCSGGRWPTSRA